MQINLRSAPLALLLGCVAGTAFAQSNGIDVTLEVLDDVSDIDAVVVRLEDEREREQERDDQAADERERDEFTSETREADADRENREHDTVTDRDERRELENEEEDLESDLESELDRTDEADHTGDDTADHTADTGETDVPR